ncbi:MAG: fibronectin type III domain-containing protein [Verrucomicrobia bacterium]|nr:fibronectin type III domain-containing protein [Verrucomicrobiota bacterium]
MTSDERFHWSPLDDDAAQQRLGPWWIILPALIGIAALAILYWRQAILAVPVPTRPLDGDTVSADRLYLDWNDLRRDTSSAHIQIAEVRNFSWRAFEARSAAGETSMRRSRVLKPATTYYWRMRTVSEDDKESPWSRKIRFETE